MSNTDKPQPISSLEEIALIVKNEKFHHYRTIGIDRGIGLDRTIITIIDPNKKPLSFSREELKDE